MKKLLLALVLLISTQVFADYFGCELKVNNDRIDNEAPYIGREVRAILGDYSCEATIDQNIVVDVTVTNLLTGANAIAGSSASASVQFDRTIPLLIHLITSLVSVAFVNLIH